MGCNVALMRCLKSLALSDLVRLRLLNRSVKIVTQNVKTKGG